MVKTGFVILWSFWFLVFLMMTTAMIKFIHTSTKKSTQSDPLSKLDIIGSFLLLSILFFYASQFIWLIIYDSLNITDWSNAQFACSAFRQTGFFVQLVPFFLFYLLILSRAASIEIAFFDGSDPAKTKCCITRLQLVRIMTGFCVMMLLFYAISPFTSPTFNYKVQSNGTCALDPATLAMNRLIGLIVTGIELIIAFIAIFLCVSPLLEIRSTLRTESEHVIDFQRSVSADGSIHEDRAVKSQQKIASRVNDGLKRICFVSIASQILHFCCHLFGLIGQFVTSWFFFLGPAYFLLVILMTNTFANGWERIGLGWVPKCCCCFAKEKLVRRRSVETTSPRATKTMTTPRSLPRLTSLEVPGKHVSVDSFSQSNTITLST